MGTHYTDVEAMKRNHVCACAVCTCPKTGFVKWCPLYVLNAIGDNKGFSNSLDPNETAHNEPSQQGLHCLTFSLST